jgi:hypothetical protein
MSGRAKLEILGMLHANVSLREFGFKSKLKGRLKGPFLGSLYHYSVCYDTGQNLYCGICADRTYFKTGSKFHVKSNSIKVQKIKEFIFRLFSRKMEVKINSFMQTSMRF